MFTNFWASPAVSTPAGREPGMRTAPRVRSRQPMARITEAHSIVARPVFSFSTRTSRVPSLSAARPVA